MQAQQKKASQKNPDYFKSYNLPLNFRHDKT